MIAALECVVCSHEFDNLQKHSDPNPACPECGAETKRVITRTHFRCVGGGWASDNYCSVTPQYKETQQRMKNAVSGRYLGDGKTLRSGLRGY
jgi:putative FmdB family regulatory protein